MLREKLVLPKVNKNLPHNLLQIYIKEILHHFLKKNMNKQNHTMHILDSACVSGLQFVPLYTLIRVYLPY